MAGVQKTLEKDERMKLRPTAAWTGVKMFGILENVETVRREMAGVERDWMRRNSMKIRPKIWGANAP